MAQGPRNQRTNLADTAAMPPVDEASVENAEPPQFLPEFPDPGSTTGQVFIVSEGEDAARFDDDSATGSEHVDSPR